VISLHDIEAARETIRGIAVETPCLPCQPFALALGLDLVFKHETLQLTGSFKVRGALNKIRSLSPREAEAGVITASAGNHAQGVAFAARREGIPALVVMPVTTPLVKIENTERLGARVLLHGETFGESHEEAWRLCRERRLTFIHPFDDELVIAGQGTIGLEILEQVPDVEAVVVPIGGGGLISGVAAAIKESRPAVRVYGVQTEAAPAMAESVRAGHRVEVPTRRSVAEGISVKQPGTITLECVRRWVDGIEVVSEDEIRAAIVDLIESGKVVAEGAAAAALAALRGGRLPELRGRKVAALLSGANIDVHLLSRIIDRSLVEHHRLVRFRTHVSDRPGALADLLNGIAAAGGNVVAIEHDRVFKHAGFWEAEVVVTLETRNAQHVADLERSLAQRGYDIEPLD
jgi:threonine dehydratase